MLVRVLYTRLDANPEEFTYSRGGIALPFSLFILDGIRTYLRGGIDINCVKLVGYVLYDSHVPTWWHRQNRTVFQAIRPCFWLICIKYSRKILSFQEMYRYFSDFFGANPCFSTLPTEQKTEVRTFPFTPPVLSRFSLSPLLF